MLTARSLALAMAASATLGCGEDQDPDGARDLWNRVFAADFRSWARPIDYEVRRPSDTSHDRFVEIFMNDTMADASRTSGHSFWPVGSVLVKESFDARGHRSLVAAMEKRDAGWFYAEWKHNGRTLFSGAPSVCVDCHERSASDFVWSVGLVRR